MAVPANDTNSDRFNALLVALVGHQVSVTVKPGVEYNAILAAATTQGDMSLVLKQAQLASDPRSPIKSTLLVQPKDLIDLRANNLDIVAQVQSAVAPPAANGSAHSASNNANSETFRTDIDISSSSGQVRERTLQTWGAQMGGDAIGGIEDDLSGMTLEDSTSKGEKWDQFAANERLYGMKSDFDEEMYTTKLDRSAADYKARAQKAAQLEREILQGPASGKLANNAHIAEERGLVTGGDALDEEDRYGAVIRGPNAYVPPQARKAGGPASANGAASRPPQLNDPAIVSTSKPAESAAPRPTVSLPTPEQHGLPKKPSPANTTSSVSQAQTANKSTLEGSFREFVSSEKERLSRLRQPMVKAAAERKDKDSRLASLLEFSQTFKLKAPMPADLATMLGRDPNAINSKSTSNTPVVSPTPAAQTTAATAGPPASGSTQKSKATTLPEIPPFNPKSGQSASSSATSDPAAKVANGASTAAVPAQAETKAPTASSSKIKMSVNAPVFVFKPNPNAASFTPGGAAKLTSPAPQAAKPPAHPFFGDSIPKKSSSSMHVKEEFTPFKNGVVPDPSTIGPQWAAFTGKSYRSIYLPPGVEPDQLPPASATPVPVAGGPPPMPMHPGSGNMPPQGFVYAAQQFQPAPFPGQRFAGPPPVQVAPPHMGQFQHFQGAAPYPPGPVPGVTFSPSPHPQAQPMPGQPYMRYGQPGPPQQGSPLSYHAERPGHPPSSAGASM